MNGTSEQLNLAKSVDQLRMMVCGLGAIVLVLSLCFGAFVLKQTLNLSFVTRARQQQLTQLKGNIDRLTSVANELATYSNGRPELMAIFRNHGITVNPNPGTTPSR